MVSRELGVVLDMNNTPPTGVTTSMVKVVLGARFVVNAVFRFSSFSSKISPGSYSLSLSPKELMLAELKAAELAKFFT